MEARWFAVDENGEIGQFDSGEINCVPVLEGMASEEELQAPHTIKPIKKYWVQGIFLEIAAPIWAGALERMRRLGFGEQKIRCFEGYQDSYWLSESEPIDLEPPFNFHFYDSPDWDSVTGMYHWVASPARPITIQELPEGLRNSRHFLFLKDYVFKSREPIDPFDHALNCFSDSKSPLASGGVYPSEMDNRTPFPIPTRRANWQEADYVENPGVFDQIFFAIDDQDHLAIFRTDGQGALPISIDIDARWARWNYYAMFSTTPEEPLTPRLDHYSLPPGSIPIPEFHITRNVWGPEQIPRLLALAKLGYPFKRHSSFDSSVKLVVPEGDLFIATKSSLIEMQDASSWIQKIWLQGWMRHWLEAPFDLGLTAPRHFGFYHYDLSWHHAAPYVRIGEPDAPVRLSDFAPEWREKMAPLRLEGVRFADAPLVQPYEHAPADRLACRSQIWINEALTQVNLCTPESVKYDDDERLLRRAKRYIAKVESLRRKV